MMSEVTPQKATCHEAPTYLLWTLTLDLVAHPANGAHAATQAPHKSTHRSVACSVAQWCRHKRQVCVWVVCGPQFPVACTTEARGHSLC